jgi:hypothetical protein
MYEVSVALTGGTLTYLRIWDTTAGTQRNCRGLGSCSMLVPKGHDIQIGMNGAPVFTVTCPGSVPRTASRVGPNYFAYGCGTKNLSGDYAITVVFGG